MNQLQKNTLPLSGGETANVTYKARLFEMIFNDKRKLLELYNAMNKTAYEDPELLEINTLSNAIYMSMHNDISFIIDSRLTLYEHQSTYNPNLPLRYLFYVADLYSAMTKDENLYGTKRLKLPTPKFVIFYNGTANQPDVQEMRLSDSFIVQGEEVSLELVSVMLNINPGHNPELMESCTTLRHYCEYTDRVRRYTREMSLEDAVERAITECIREGILEEFLRGNRAEAKKMSIYEYDEERHMRQTREEGWEEGKSAGLAEGELRGRIKSILEFLEELGEVPEELTQEICTQENPDILKKWLKLAARADSVDEFVQKHH